MLLYLLEEGRIIPAYAGSTWTRRSPSISARDHPRVCGEHTLSAHWRGQALGSSPRMRGAPQAINSLINIIRIIPAYAGSTMLQFSTEGNLKDHPRVCGEHGGLAGDVQPKLGSSPRMRGALTVMVRARPVMRIIPAYAGSTRRRWQGDGFRRDHPRVCGEHNMVQFVPFSWTGSSPRMRGAPLPPRQGPQVPGIIPAYAGSTFRCRRSRSAPTDHPRVCGEHASWSRCPMAGTGSSPRMRGALRLPALIGICARIIPAYAGSTRRGKRVQDSRRDHPRVCGEHDIQSVIEPIFRGSSPRMRGAHDDPSRYESMLRIIPAYAGSTIRDSLSKNHI